MKVRQVFRQYSYEIVNLLNKLNNFIVILTDENLDILDYTEGLSKVCRAERELKGMNLSALLVKDKEVLKYVNEKDRVFLIIKGKDGIEMAYHGFVFRVDNYYLFLNIFNIFLIEHYRLTYNELIIKLSRLNEEVMVKIRELARRNFELKKALVRIKEFGGKDSLTGILNRRAFMRIFVKK